MAVTVTYDGSTIHTSERSETFTLLTNNLVMKSDIVVYAGAESKVSIIYNGEPLNLDTTEGEHTYNLLCDGKLMLSNLTFSVTVSGSIAYNRVIKCTTNDPIVIPESEDDAIMIVVIGGGTGGQGGYNGKVGNKPTKSGGTTSIYYVDNGPVGNRKIFGKTTASSVYMIDPTTYYKSVSIDRSTGKFTFSGVWSTAINRYTLTGQQYAYYVNTTAFGGPYKYKKESDSSYYALGVDNSTGEIYGYLHQSVRRSETVGEKIRYSSHTLGGEGGQGGTGGSGGKVLRKELTISSGATATIHIGSGGAKGTSGGVYGASGSATTISINDDIYSSDDGILMPDGFVNTVGVEDPEVYASQGITGVAGAYGGGYTSYYNSEVGKNVGGNTGGAVGPNLTSGSKYIGGGSGGGAAYGVDGDPGVKAYATKTGKGGNGANALNASSALLQGCGGNGGHGGGGGGNAGGSQISGVSVSSGGSGGNGGSGSNGADGIVLLYYRVNEE